MARDDLVICPATGKHQFTTWALAAKRAKRLNNYRDVIVEPFRCHVCGHVHIGAIPFKRRHHLINAQRRSDDES